MGDVFNADEVFEMAEQIERNGASFYRRAAEISSASSAGEKFLELAAMEDDHEKKFAAMRKELSGNERMTTVFDPDNQEALYLRAMADGYVFDVKADPAALLTGMETREEILRIAINLEKDSIIFYLGIKDMIPDNLGKNRIDDIIAEEKSHITLLSGQLGIPQ